MVIEEKTGVIFISGSKRLTLKDKCIYGLAGVGDGTGYCMIGTFFMFFLTSVAGVSPATAGFIVAIGTLWNVFVGPFVGFFSDNCTSGKGRRRPFLFCGAIPLAISTALLFTFVDFSPALKFIYYAFMIVFFWSSFSCFFVPYAALGSEITTDYDERTDLRAFTSIANSIGNLIGTVMPSVLVGLFVSAGQSETHSWTITSMCIGVFACCAVLATGFGAKQWDSPADVSCKENKFSLKYMLLEYFEILKLKPMLILIGTSIICLGGLTMFMADRLYFFTYCEDYSSGQISFILLFGCASGLVAPVVVKIVMQFMDRRMSFITTMSVAALMMMVFRFWTIGTLWQMLILMFIFGVANMTYWQLMPALLYDLCEYDEYVNNKHRSGEIISLQGLSEGVAEALGSQFLGIILQISGFVSEAQSQSVGAMTGINNCMVIFPSILILISCVFMWKYPITKEKFKNIQAELAKRKG